MKRYCYALDLVYVDVSTKEYIDYQNKVWPEILKSILDAGISLMEIYCFENRPFYDYRC